MCHIHIMSYTDRWYYRNDTGKSTFENFPNVCVLCVCCVCVCVCVCIHYVGWLLRISHVGGLHHHIQFSLACAGGLFRNSEKSVHKYIYYITTLLRKVVLFDHPHFFLGFCRKKKFSRAHALGQWICIMTIPGSPPWSNNIGSTFCCCVANVLLMCC